MGAAGALGIASKGKDADHGGGQHNRQQLHGETSTCPSLHVHTSDCLDVHRKPTGQGSPALAETLEFVPPAQGTEACGACRAEPPDAQQRPERQGAR